MLRRDLTGPRRERARVSAACCSSFALFGVRYSPQCRETCSVCAGSEVLGEEGRTPELFWWER
eukprot:1452211-Rhodomonas_salina.1